MAVDGFADSAALCTVVRVATTKRKGGRRAKASIAPPRTLREDDAVLKAILQTAYLASDSAEDSIEHRPTYLAIRKILDAIHDFAGAHADSSPDLRDLSEHAQALHDRAFTREVGPVDRPLGRIDSRQRLDARLAYELEEIVTTPYWHDWVINFDAWTLAEQEELQRLDRTARFVVGVFFTYAVSADERNAIPLRLTAREIRSRVLAGVAEKWGDGYPSDRKRNERWLVGVVRSVMRQLGFSDGGYR